MRKLLFIFVICVLSTAASYAEDAAIVGESKLRLGINQSLGYADEEFLAATGFGAEYGTSPWLNLQLFWNPGFKYKPEMGFNSLFLGVKGYILGEGALAPVGDKVRLSAAIGMLVPLYGEPDLIDQDQMLWGTALRLYSDFIFSKYFYLNLFVEGIFYPPQYTDNEVFYGNWTRHYLDLTEELEAHFEFTAKNGVRIKFGFPIRFFYAPYMNDSDDYATTQYSLSSGVYFAVITPSHYPVEIILKYNANILGQNVNQVHRGGIIFKITTGELKRRVKTANNAENSESESETKNEE